MLPTRIAAAVVTATLVAFAWLVPDLRRELIRDVVTWDAVPTDPAPLPGGVGPGLSPVARTRVVLIDGLAADIAPLLPAWTSLCKNGVTLRVDVGFPTVSLPVEVALWTGLTQQQTGIVFRSDRPLVPPLDKHAIPAQVAGSVAIAENHGWIVRSLGFSITEPAADPDNLAKDAEASREPGKAGLPPSQAAWSARWEERAREAVASPAPLVFVHILRVDTAGHKFGVSDEYNKIALEADAILGRLVAADPAARWFALSDHGHLAVGGHGGEERSVRQVQSCVAGPGVSPGRGELVHVVDVARAIADSTGATLDPESRGRPWSAALASPLVDDQAIPATPLGNGAIAIFLIVAGLGLSTWGVRRWWLAPWWFFIACGSLFVVRGEPTLSMRMVYAPEGRDMYFVWLPSLALAAVVTWFGLRARFARFALARVVIAQLAIPIAAAAASITACGGWPAVIGHEVAPVVPHFTAWMSALLLMAAHGAAAVALAVLATLVRPPSDRRGSPEPPRSEPAAGA